MTQAQALDILKLGHNVFLTGAAGSGKTFVLNKFIAHLRSSKIGVGITASTGIAALHIQGMTIHSWSGLGIRDSLSPGELAKLLAKPRLVKRFAKTRVLIIDEVSMLHGQRLEVLDGLARAFKGNDKPFGGMQLVLCGDLCQLPPVTRGGEPDFVFNANVWPALDLKVCYLDEQHRQGGGELLEILNAIRSGTVSAVHHKHLSHRTVHTPPARPVITKLYTHNADVERINQIALDGLSTKTRNYEMRTSGSKKLVAGLIASCLAPELLELKKGAEVMFVANEPGQRYMNGTRGRVIGFSDEGAPQVTTSDGRRLNVTVFTWQIREGERVLASLEQLPLRLAWAITIHKSQGMSLDAAEVDLSRAFEPGMGYVALSRLRHLDGLYLVGINAQALMINPAIASFDLRLRRDSARLQQALEKLEPSKLIDNQRLVFQHLSPVDAPMGEYDQKLFEALRTWRFKRSKLQGVPSYIILGDKALKHLAATRPQTLDALIKVPGIGPAKRDQYGPELLKLLKP